MLSQTATKILEQSDKLHGSKYVPQHKSLFLNVFMGLFSVIQYEIYKFKCYDELAGVLMKLFLFVIFVGDFKFLKTKAVQTCLRKGHGCTRGNPSYVCPAASLTHYDGKHTELGFLCPIEQKVPQSYLPVLQNCYMLFLNNSK